MYAPISYRFAFLGNGWGKHLLVNMKIYLSIWTIHICVSFLLGSLSFTPLLIFSSLQLYLLPLSHRSPFHIVFCFLSLLQFSPLAPLLFSLPIFCWLLSFILYLRFCFPFWNLGVSYFFTQFTLCLYLPWSSFPSPVACLYQSLFPCFLFFRGYFFIYFYHPFHNHRCRFLLASPSLSFTT